MRVALWTASLLMLGGGISGTPAAAGHASGGSPVRIFWARPNRVPVARRAYLTRVLTLAVEGKPIQGAGVRDSRPQVRASDFLAPGASPSGSPGKSSPVLLPE